MKQICLECPERCFLTEKEKDCSKIGDRIWLHRQKIICRTCPYVEETCYECTRQPSQDYVGENNTKSWEQISARLYENYIQRKSEKKIKYENK